MNPLDKQELEAFLQNMNNEMPSHADSTVKIKRSYSQGMPKNLMDYSVQVDDKFLDNNLAIIEEINHRDQSNIIPKWFKDYQIKYFGKFGILNKDRFFTSRMRDGYRKFFSPDLTEIREIGYLPYAGTTLGFGTIGTVKVNGADLSGGGTSLHQATNKDYIYAILVGNGSGVIGQYYDRSAINVFSGAGNERLGAYDDSSNSPNTLLAEGSSHTCSTGYNWNSLTEFSLTTARVYVAKQHDDASANIYQDSSLNNPLKLNTFATAFPNTWTTSTNTTDTPNVKLGHS